MRGVMLLSTVVCLLSVVILAFTFKMLNSDIMTQTPDDKPNPLARTMATVLITCSIVAMLTSICGVLAAKCEGRRWVAMVFGSFLLIVVVVYLVFGLMLGLFSSTNFAKMEQFCAAEDDAQVGRIGGVLRDVVTNADRLVTQEANLNMCSETCPCHMKYATTWGNSLGDEAFFNSYGRTNKGTEGFVPLKFEAIDGETFFDSYKECLDAKKAAESGAAESETPAADAQDAPADAGASRLLQDEDAAPADSAAEITVEPSEDEPAEKTAQEKAEETNPEMVIKLISYLETQDEGCSGICKKGLFYYGLSLEKGVPTKTCLSSFKKEIDRNATYLGFAIAGVGVVGFALWLLQYALWKQYLF